MGKLTTLTMAALALGLAAAPAMAQDDWNAWDTNGDGILDNNEFSAGFGKNDVFGTWDAHDDGLLSEDESNTGLFDV